MTQIAAGHWHPCTPVLRCTLVQQRDRGLLWCYEVWLDRALLWYFRVQGKALTLSSSSADEGMKQPVSARIEVLLQPHGNAVKVAHQQSGSMDEGQHFSRLQSVRRKVSLPGAMLSLIMPSSKDEKCVTSCCLLIWTRTC